MKAYVSYLLEDIKKAHRNEFSGPNDDDLSFEEQMEEVEKYATGIDPPPSLGYKTGLSTENFPPVSMLSLDEMNVISDAFKEMLLSFNMEVDFPSGIPIERAYPLLIGLLDKEAWYLPGGTLHFDFCTRYAPDCQLKEYCPCLKYWNEPVAR